MKALKFGALGLILATVLGFVVTVSPVKAQTFDNTNLGSLIVLNGLFNDGGFGGNNLRGLAGLIAVENATGDGMGGSGLGDLIVLNGLFNGGDLGGNNLRGLAGLIAVSNITD